MNKFILTVLIATACFGASLLSAFVVAENVQQPANAFGSVDAPPIQRFTNLAVASVTTTSGQVVSTSTGRRLLMLQNVGPTVVYCAFNGNLGVDQQGFFMTSSSTRRFPDGNEPVYTGAINCIASSTTKILVNESQY